MWCFTRSKAVEYTSLKILNRERTANCRSSIPLAEKYTKPVTAAQEIGWDLRQVCGVQIRRVWLDTCACDAGGVAR